VREVIQLNGYDRRAQQFRFERVFPLGNGVIA